MWWCHKLLVQNANITIYPTTANQNVDTDGGRTTIITILLIYCCKSIIFTVYDRSRPLGTPASSHSPETCMLG